MKALYKEEGKPFVEATFEFLYDLPSFCNIILMYSAMRD